VKKILKPLFFLSVLIFCTCPNIYASIDNNIYDINMLCLGDVENYCDALTLNKDESNFYIESMTLGFGSYTDNGLLIKAELTSTNPFIYKYEFEITAINFFDLMLV